MRYRHFPFSICICAALVFAGSVPVFASVDPSLLSLVPAETVLLTGIDANATRNSQFGQYLLQRMHTEDQNYQSVMQDTGFDPRRDLQTILFAGFGPRQTRGRTRFAVLARGMFDPDRIGAAAEAKGLVSQDYGGLKMYISHRHHRGPTAFAFPDTGIAIMGDLFTVREIIDHRTSASTLDPGLLDRINKAGPSNDIWFASVMSGSFLGNRLSTMTGQNAAGANALQAIQQSSGGIHFGDAVTMTLDATARSQEDAVALTDVVRFLASVAQTQRQTDPNLALVASALDGMQLRTSGSDVYVSISIPEKSLEQLAQATTTHAQ